MYEYSATIRRVVDGDTVDVLVDLGFSVGIKERVRLHGIDTPESRTRDLREKKFGKIATARVKELMPVGETFVMTSKSYDSKGKFGRGMVDFQIPNYGNLTRTLLNERLAVPYHGQNKKEIRVDHEANWDALDMDGRS